MTTFKPGDRCRVVEHDEETYEPIEGGKVYEAVVEHGGITLVNARLRIGSRTGVWTFWQGGGWGATPELSRWRLMPATDEDAATAAGEG